MDENELSSDSSAEEGPTVIKKIKLALEEFSLTENTNWKSRCLNEIPEDCLCKIIAMTQPMINLEHYKDVYDESMWKQFYSSYKKWKSCVYREFAEEIILEIPLLPLERQISCTAVWKEYLAVSTTMGEIIVYDLSNPNLPPVEFKYEGRIIRVIFWQSNIHKLFIVSLSSSNKINFWDIESTKQLTEEITVYGSNICAGTMHNLFIENNGSIFNHEYNVSNDPSHTENQKKIQLSLINDEKVAAMASEKDEMIVVSVYSVYARVFYLTVPVYNNSFFKIVKISPYIELFEAGMNVDSYYFYIPNLSLIIGVFNNCIGFLTTNNDNWYLNTSELGKNIRSVTMHANLLILGLKTGEIKLLPVDDEKLFVTNIEMFWSHDIRIDNDLITSLSLSEFNKKPHIIVATHKNLYSLYPLRLKADNADENQLILN